MMMTVMVVVVAVAADKHLLVAVLVVEEEEFARYREVEVRAEAAGVAYAVLKQEVEVVDQPPDLVALAVVVVLVVAIVSRTENFAKRWWSVAGGVVVG